MDPRVGLVATAMVGLAILNAQKAAEAPVRAVDSVDLKRYVGIWYEIARLPNRFQDHCARDVLAKYTLRPDGRIDVVNSCRKADGTVDEAPGIARRAEKDASNAKLKVRFAPAFLSFLPMVWGDYWIIGLAPDYNWAVVGEPSRRYLWILARTPKLGEPSYSQALEIARHNGYDVSGLVLTPQGK